MFVDGLYYAAISNNMAHGIGTFWTPRFSETIYHEFYEHPPLVFGIQSLFFKVLGSGFYVERLYALIVLVITIVLMDRIWKQFLRERKELRDLSYIPIILFLINEDVFRGYTNNLLECTMGLFIFGAVSLMITSIYSTGIREKLYIAGSGLMIGLAYLSKGPTAFFPLIFFILFYFIFSDFTWRRALTSSIILFISVICFFMIILSFEGARHNILQHLDKQVLSALVGKRTENIQASHFHIMKRLLEISLVPIVTTALVLLLLWLKKILHIHRSDKTLILFYLSLALSGSLPLMLSIKQASFYLIPSLPFYCFALGLLIAGGVSKMIKNFAPGSITYKISLLVTILMLTIASLYIIDQAGRIDKRDRNKLVDIHLMGQLIPENSVVNVITPAADYSMYGYLQRYYYISCDISANLNRDYLIIDKSSDSIARNGYVRIGLTTRQYNLMQRRVLFESNASGEQEK